uniref:Uncharacterized protein n=1 Tax=Tetradesmus obliquus TaxID=3088 RepID=A0A383VDV9_TETOB|eukprot:jgi/Sobl393_1/14247/SZX63735.1
MSALWGGCGAPWLQQQQRRSFRWAAQLWCVPGRIGLASEVVQHMLQIGLPAAQGQDPLTLLLAAREARFAAAMQAVAADHERAVGRLRAAMAAAAADEKMQVGGAAVTRAW